MNLLATSFPQPAGVCRSVNPSGDPMLPLTDREQALAERDRLNAARGIAARAKAAALRHERETVILAFLKANGPISKGALAKRIGFGYGITKSVCADLLEAGRIWMPTHNLVAAGAGPVRR